MSARRVLSGLAAMRSALAPSDPDVRVAAAGSVEEQLVLLGADLSAEPGQQEHLARLRELVRRGLDPADAPAGWDDAARREIGGLLAEMERAEDARLRRLDATEQAAARVLVVSGAAGGAAALLAVLLAVGLVQWEAARRRRTVRSLARLVVRRRELEEWLEYLAKHDALTGLPNRRRLLEILGREIRGAELRRRAVSVLVLGVSRLEHLNGLLGPEAGDELLVQLAGRLRAAVGEQGAVARLGGSELAVVRAEDPGEGDAAAAAESMREVVSGIVRVGAHDLALTVNAGIAVYPRHGGDARALLRSAELALARARAQGRNAVQVFDETLRRGAAEAVALETRLGGALRNGEYLVHYQPYCDLVTGEVGGVEALVKWRNGGLGLIPAARFIPLLEDTGMIVDVGRWVLETACGQIAAWQGAGRAWPISVNLSVVQFRDKRLLGTIADALKAFRVDPGLLALEVTESVCLQDVEFAARTLKRLKDMGLSLSVDDFGTGYSSLSYLKRLPVDSIKIDISFVRDVARDQDAASIVSAITSLARGLKLGTIAEGVETEEQRKILHLLRCEMGQGYLFGPAVPAAELGDLAEGEAPARVPQALVLRGRRA